MSAFSSALIAQRNYLHNSALAEARAMVMEGEGQLPAMQNILSTSSSRPVHLDSNGLLSVTTTSTAIHYSTQVHLHTYQVRACKDARKMDWCTQCRALTGIYAPKLVQSHSGHKMDRARSAPLIYNTIDSVYSNSARVWDRVGCDRCWLASRFNDPLVDGMVAGDWFIFLLLQ